MNSFQVGGHTSREGQSSIYQCQAVWADQNELHQSTTEAHQKLGPVESIMPNNTHTCLYCTN